MAIMGLYSSICLKQLTGQLVCPIHRVLHMVKAAAQRRGSQGIHQPAVNGS